MNPLYYIPITIGYSLVGIGWSFLRWTQFFDGEMAYYDKQRQGFLNANRIRGQDIPEFLVFEWRDIVRKSERLQAIPPETKNHIPEIGFDIVLWPLSMVLLVIQKVFSIFIQLVVAQYSKASTKKRERVKKDLNK